MIKKNQKQNKGLPNYKLLKNLQQSSSIQLTERYFR